MKKFSFVLILLLVHVCFLFLSSENVSASFSYPTLPSNVSTNFAVWKGNDGKFHLMNNPTKIFDYNGNMLTITNVTSVGICEAPQTSGNYFVYNQNNSTWEASGWDSSLVATGNFYDNSFSNVNLPYSDACGGSPRNYHSNYPDIPDQVLSNAYVFNFDAHPPVQYVQLVWLKSTVWTGLQDGPQDLNGHSWKDYGFDDSSWSSVILPDSGSDSNADDRYYRAHFDWDGVSSLNINFSSDDGLAIYINGNLLGNWGAGWRQPGCVNVSPTCTGTLVPEQSIPVGLLNAGDNVIAIDLWNGTIPCCYNLDVTLSQSGLGAYWSFDSCTAIDDSGNGNNGTLYGNPQCVSGEKGKAFSFNGTSDYIEVPSSSSQQISTNEITVSAWIRLSDDVGVTQWRIAEKQQTREISWGLEIFGNGYYGATGNNINFHDSNGLGWVNCLASEINLNPTTWYHAAATDSGGIIKIYINGVLVHECLNGVGIPSLIVSPIEIARNLMENNFFFNGIIDEVRIYNRALTDAEIQELYSGYVPPPQPCTYTYSDWGTCQPNSTQTRTATATPDGCTGTPDLSRSCNYLDGSSILITKYAKKSQIGSGAQAIFDITIENNGKTPLVNIEVKDDQCDELKADKNNNNNYLAIGDKLKYTCVKKYVTHDLTNIAAVKAVSINGTIVTSSATATVKVDNDLVCDPSLYENICDKKGQVVTGFYILSKKESKKYDCNYGGYPDIVVIDEQIMPNGDIKCIEQGIVGDNFLGGCTGWWFDRPSHPPERYTQECFNHDLCVRSTGHRLEPCKTEFDIAQEGWTCAEKCPE
jgi:hypothetical protein